MKHPIGCHAHLAIDGGEDIIKGRGPILGHITCLGTGTRHHAALESTAGAS